MFKTVADVKAANKEIGHHYFDRKTMRFFNSVIESGMYGGRFFITSERREPHFPKKYTIREALPSGEVKTASVGGFQAYLFIEDAREAARALVNRAE